MSSDAELLTGAAATGQWFGPDLAAPVAARRFARDFLAAAGAGTRRQEEAELLVSELVTNVVVHARTAARILLRVTDGTARIEISDEDPSEPRPRQPGRGGGFGLWLLDRVAASWGVIRGEGDRAGKTVWFTLPLTVPGT